MTKEISTQIVDRERRTLCQLETFKVCHGWRNHGKQYKSWIYCFRLKRKVILVNTGEVIGADELQGFCTARSIAHFKKFGIADPKYYPGFGSMVSNVFVAVTPKMIERAKKQPWYASSQKPGYACKHPFSAIKSGAAKPAYWERGVVDRYYKLHICKKV